MRSYRYSYHAAKMVLRVIVLGLGGTAVGHALTPGWGAGIGATVGLLAVAALVARDSWIQRRGNAWVRKGRSRGLWGRGAENELPGLGLQGVAEWLAEHRKWRVELAGKFVLGFSPRTIFPVSRLAEVVEAARSLQQRLTG